MSKATLPNLGAHHSRIFCAEVGGAGGLSPWVEIELRQVEGMVFQRQRRYREAARALDRAAETATSEETTA